MSPLALSLRFLQAQPDSRLVALARDGHEPAFEALVRRYRKELLTYCRRLQPQSAEDALQQTLLQAWKALTAGAPVRDVRPWLYRIAHNVTVSNLRVAVATPQEIRDSAGGLEVDQLVEQRLQARAALAGMATLPALQRQVMVSTALDGASHEQVAGALGLSSGAVRGLIYRARSTLRSAAAALTPSPALHWALRRAEARSGVGEALAGGGGLGIAGLVVKGGAVITLAGAVAGAGGLALSHPARDHRHRPARLIGSARSDGGSAALAPASPVGIAGIADATEHRLGGRGSTGRGDGPGGREPLSGRHDSRGRDAGSGTDDSPRSAGGTNEEPSSGRDGSGSGGSGSDGGATSITTAASSDGGTGSDGSGTSGSSNRGDGSTATGTDGTSSGGRTEPSVIGQATTADGGSGPSSSSDGGSSGSGSVDTTTSTVTDGGH